MATSRKRPTPRANVLGRFAFSAVCLGLALLAAKFAWLEGHTGAAASALNDDRDASRARALLELAGNSTLLSPEAVLLSGRLNLGEDAAKSISRFRTQIAMRPMWPDGYAWLAVAKARSRQFDPEFEAALSQALALGRYRNRVLTILASAGPQLALGMRPDQREQLLEQLLWATPMAWDAAGDVAERLGFAPYWCRTAPREFPGLTRAINAWCQPRGWVDKSPADPI